MKKFKNSDVAAKFKTFPKEMRSRLLDLRALIFSVAESIEGVGEIEEVLKWGEPSFLTSETNSGSMIRINATKIEGQYAIYFLCQTSLVKTFRELYPKSLTYRLAKKSKLI